MDLKILYPTNKPYITQRYGVKSSAYWTYHHGTDFRTWNDPEKEIKACLDGKVVYVDTTSTNNWYSDGKKINGKTTSAYGVHCIIQHQADGVFYYSLYGHCSKIYIEQGQEVKAGDVIAKGGNTGKSRGEHLHFEFRKGSNVYSKAINSEDFFVAHLEVIPDWGTEAWKWAKAKKILSAQSQFDDPVSKGELAVILQRFYNLIK